MKVDELEGEAFIIKDSSDIPDELFLLAPKQRCLGLSCMRFFGFIMVFFVLGIFFLVVHSVWTHFGDLFFVEFVTTVELSFFLFITSLAILSYFQTMFTDPGGIPLEWHSKVEQSQHLSNFYPKCRRTELFKPPRSFYDQLSGRVILNLDHYCPWVNNAVGFFNRKFFVLFVLYAWLGCSQAALLLLPFGGGALGLSGEGRALVPIKKKRVDSTRVVDDFGNEVLTIMAFVFSLAFSFALLFFVGSHFYMVLKNMTSVQRWDESRRFDLGYRRNWEQTFGRNPFFWFLPVYAEGPVGDGVHWLTKHGYWDGLEQDDWVRAQTRRLRADPKFSHLIESESKDFEKEVQASESSGIEMRHR